MGSQGDLRQGKSSCEMTQTGGCRIYSKSEAQSRASWDHIRSRLRALKLAHWALGHEVVGLHGPQAARKRISRGLSPLPEPALEAPFCWLSIPLITFSTSGQSLDSSSSVLAEIMLAPASEHFPMAYLGLAVQQWGLRSLHAHHSMVLMAFRP